MNNDLYSFVFKGLLCEEALDKSGRTSKTSISAILERDLIKRLSIDLLDDDLVANSRRMATAYAAIAAFENSVREFVSKLLLEKIGESWWTSCVPEKIRHKAESRKQEEDKIRWHTHRGNDPINYTEFGDLASIICQNWEQFEPYLDSQEWVRQIIKTIEKSRNVIMHSGELAGEDIERIGTFIRDWIRQVGA